MTPSIDQESVSMNGMLNLDTVSDLEDGRDTPEPVEQKPADVGTQARCQIVLRSIPGVTLGSMLEVGQ